MKKKKKKKHLYIISYVTIKQNKRNMLQPAKLTPSWTSSIRITSFVSLYHFVVNFICTVSFHCLVGELSNRGRKFKVGNSFARAVLSLLIRLWEFSRAVHIAERISRAWDKSSFGTRVKRMREDRQRKGQEGTGGDGILLRIGVYVLSGRARFIRYFSRDLSIHSLILRLPCVDGKLLPIFF